ncbi:sensor histidine kinase [Altererythrobacter endophyticus]|uniref:Sensor histidine kinase n=2 Tax=Altericroceibacterium endophyticum TaxID=1808508 RepID=A0A6I4T5A8_9SPHN|nr:sensor histidine kinase [Altericroceibacterium endophyticum]
MVLASIVGLWFCYFILSTLRAQMFDFGFEQELLGRRALASLAGILITIGFWLILRLFDRQPLWAKIAAALLLSLPVAVLMAQANQLAFADMQEQMLERLNEKQALKFRRDDHGDLLVEVPRPDVGTLDPSAETGGAQMITIDRQPEQEVAWQQLAELSFARYFMLLAWCALYLALLTGEKARAAERREGDYRRAAKAAELRSLRYQVNPHFLFNTLNSLSALVLTGKNDAAERMIQTISVFYRRSLAGDPTSDVPLRQEFALQQLYLEIEAVRFPQRLKTDYQLPDNVAEACVPGMILQPLVENSVKHAVATSTSQVTITLSAREEYGRLLITIADDGNGQNKSTQQGHGIGLANVRERLEARFGEEASIVSGKVEGGYATHIRIPLIGQERTGNE